MPRPCVPIRPKIYRELGLRLAEANSLDMLGRVTFATAQYAQAAFRQVGDRQAQAEALAALGALALDTVGLAEARAYYDQALHLAREVRSPIDGAHALVGTARCAQRAGDRPAALAAAEQALAGYERSGAAETARTREYCAILRSLPSDTPVRSDASLGKLP